MSLCHVCQSLPLTVANLRDNDVPYHASLKHLKKSADAGCPFCLLCWTALYREKAPGFQERYDGVFPAGIDPERNTRLWLNAGLDDAFEIDDPRTYVNLSMGSHLSVSCGKVRGGGYWPEEDTFQGNAILAYLRIHASPGTGPSRWVRGRCFGDHGDPLSSQVETVREWLQMCQVRHEKCRATSSSRMPTRLLEVGSETHRPRLVTGQIPNEPFAALSYCWGSSTHDRLTLLSTNIEKLCEGIDVSKLAKTNREALLLTQRLGIRYLWIDALCIMQNNQKDWESESKRMADVYGAAILTIVAGKASDAAQGFLQCKPKDGPRHVAIPYSHPVDGTASGSVFVSLSRRPDEGPTSTRAWCFQEKILSNRMAVFGSQQLYFHCQERTLYEDGSFENRTADTENSQLHREVRSGDLASQRLLLSRWYRLVEQYGSREMSNPSDVFPAIAGIARLIERSLNIRFLAGLWEDDLIRGLLWLPRSLQSRSLFQDLSLPSTDDPRWRHLDHTKRAPSWSWASKQGPVTYSGVHQPKYDRLFHDRKRWMIYPTIDSPPDHWTTQDSELLQGCKLQIKGVSKAVRPSAALSVEDDRSLLRTHLLKRAASMGRVRPLVDADSSIVAYGIFDITDQDFDELWCLRIIDISDLAQGGLMPPVDALILKRNSDGTYARVGACQVVQPEFFRGEKVHLTLM